MPPKPGVCFQRNCDNTPTRTRTWRSLKPAMRSLNTSMCSLESSVCTDTVLNLALRSWGHNKDESLITQDVSRGVVTHVTCGMSENTMLDMVMLPTASVSEMIQCFLSPVRGGLCCASGRVRGLTDTIPSQTTTCKSSTYRLGMRMHKSLSYSKLEN